MCSSSWRGGRELEARKGVCKCVCVCVCVFFLLYFAVFCLLSNVAEDWLSCDITKLATVGIWLWALAKPVSKLNNKKKKKRRRTEISTQKLFQSGFHCWANGINVIPVEPINAQKKHVIYQIVECKHWFLHLLVNFFANIYKTKDKLIDSRTKPTMLASTCLNIMRISKKKKLKKKKKKKKTKAIKNVWIRYTPSW